MEKAFIPWNPGKADTSNRTSRPPDLEDVTVVIEIAPDAIDPFLYQINLTNCAVPTLKLSMVMSTALRSK